MKSILKKSAVLSILSVLLITLIIPVFAHPGSLDENGGHWNHKTGEYHYHAGTHSEGSNNTSSSSTTRYYYDFEEFEDYTTSNFNNSANNSIQEETTPYLQHEDEPSIGEIILYIFLAFFIGLPICWFGYFFILDPIIVSIYESVKLIKQNIELRDKLFRYKKIKYSIFPFKKQNVFLTEEWFQIERENIIKELMSFDCMKLKETFPEDVLLKKTFDLGFKNTGFYSPYSRYTVYKAYSGNELHKKHNCGLSMLQQKLSLNYDADSAYYILCKECWESTDMNDYPDLFMPDWYKQYKEVKDKMDKYHITAADIRQKKQKNEEKQMVNQ